MRGEKLFLNCKVQPSFSSKGLKKVDYVERQVQQMHDRVLGHLLGCAVALSGHFAGLSHSCRNGHVVSQAELQKEGTKENNTRSFTR